MPPMLHVMLASVHVRSDISSSPEVIRLVAIMYVRYPLSLHNVEDLLAERGIDIGSGGSGLARCSPRDPKQARRAHERLSSVALMEWMPPPDGIAMCQGGDVCRIPRNAEGIHGNCYHYCSRPCKAVLSGARRSSGWKRSLSKETHARESGALSPHDRLSQDRRRAACRRAPVTLSRPRMAWSNEPMSVVQRLQAGVTDVRSRLEAESLRLKPRPSELSTARTDSSGARRPRGSPGRSPYQRTPASS
jgi:hypothetical protein